VAPIAKKKGKLFKKKIFFVPIDWRIMEKKLIDYASID
jgi:hypothetical protein